MISAIVKENQMLGVLERDDSTLAARVCDITEWGYGNNKASAVGCRHDDGSPNSLVCFVLLSMCGLGQPHGI